MVSIMQTINVFRAHVKHTVTMTGAELNDLRKYKDVY